MQQKSTKLVRIQKFVQDIKEQPQCKQSKKVMSQTQRIRNPVTESTNLINGLIPLSEDPKFDAMMDNIKRILEKRKRQPEGPKEQLKTMLTTNQVKQIYGSRRHMIEVRFKEFYHSRIVSPHQFVEVTNTHKDDEGKSSRLFQYQRRIGLVKKKDLLEEKIQEIGQRHRTKQ